MSLSGAALFVLTLAAPSLSDTEGSRLASYPDWAVLAEASAAFHVEAVIDASGKPRSCRITSFAGNERLASDFCKNLMRRRFRSARTVDDKPVDGLYQTTVIMRVSGKSADGPAVESYRYEGDPILRVSKVPGAIEKFPYVYVAVAVGEDGIISGCQGEPNRFTKGLPAAVFDASCGMLKGAKFEGAPELLSGKSFVAQVPVRLVD